MDSFHIYFFLFELFEKKTTKNSDFSFSQHFSDVGVEEFIRDWDWKITCDRKSMLRKVFGFTSASF